MDDKVKSVFAENLRRLLKKHDLKQADIARYMGVSSATVSDWCNGRKVPRMDKISWLASWLSVNVSDLICEPVDDKDYLLKFLVSTMNELNDNGKNMLLEYMRLLALDPKYKKDRP